MKLKLIHLVVVFTLTKLITFGQNETDKVFVSPENTVELESYLEKNVEYPLIAYSNGVEGNVWVSFDLS
ncbi:hypothetical protein, partial [Flammeovirga agarivorans]